MTVKVDGINGLTFADSSTQNVTALNASNITSGTLGKARMATGSVLQVVNATFGTYTVTSSTSPVDTGLTATITPSSTSSRILAFTSINGIERGNNNVTARFLLVRNSTTILSFENSIFSGWPSGGFSWGNTSTSYLDSPATTSATTYKVQFNVSSGSGTLYINNYSTGGNGTTNCTLTLMEIAG